jgi:catalase
MSQLSLPEVRLVDALSQLNRERIPERVVHANGTGVFGEFEVGPASCMPECGAI